MKIHSENPIQLIEKVVLIVYFQNPRKSLHRLPIVTSTNTCLPSYGKSTRISEIFLNEFTPQTPRPHKPDRTSGTQRNLIVIEVLMH